MFSPLIYHMLRDLKLVVLKTSSPVVPTTELIDMRTEEARQLNKTYVDLIKMILLVVSLVYSDSLC